MIELTEVQAGIIAFHTLYDQCVKICATHKAAYDLAERRYKAKYKKRKYKTYISFANSRQHYLTNIATKKSIKKNIR